MTSEFKLVTREPIIIDHGIFADHDQACAVCRTRPAVLELAGWQFQPCWQCQEEGWRLSRSRANALSRAFDQVRGVRPITRPTRGLPAADAGDPEAGEREGAPGG